MIPLLKAIRLFLLLEMVVFTAAALTHFGVLTHGYEHRAAGTAESVIAVVLLIGFAFSWIFPMSIRSIGLTAQGFALFGTLVRIYTIAVGIGPRTALDVTYHTIMVIALVSGLVVAFRARTIKSVEPAANSRYRPPQS